MKASIGIDIGKRKCDYCVVDGRGVVVERGQYLNTIPDTRECARRLAEKYRKKGSCKAACETTANMWRITYEAFESAGIEIKLANTFEMAIINKTGKKTDKVDAQKIANVLRVDMIPECYVPSKKVRGIRNMVRHRVKLVRDRTHVINRIHSILDGYGRSVQATKMYSQKGVKQLEGIALETTHETLVLRQCIRQMMRLTEDITTIDNELEADAAENRDARLLASMSGVGPFIALLMAAEIDGISRFPGPKKLVSMAGLCPTVRQSSKKTRMNRIKKLNSNKLVNWAMCEAAQIAVRHDPKMAAAYESARRRHADKHALGIVAVAHKMVTIMWHILHTKTPYQSRNQKLYERKLNRMKRARQRRE